MFNSKNMKQKKGFTLIELLVVVGVISILAATVIVNLRGVRERAMDTRVQGAMGQVRSVAEIIHMRAGALGYSALCAATESASTLNATPTELATLDAEIFANNGGNSEVCFSTATDYCVSARFIEVGQHWCISSIGRVGRTTTSCTTATACPPFI